MCAYSSFRHCEVADWRHLLSIQMMRSNSIKQKRIDNRKKEREKKQRDPQQQI